MLAFAILLGFNLLGVFIQQIFHLALPGNVIGLILFIAALFLKWIKLEWVETSAQFLLQHMMLFFAPLIVGVIVFFPLLGEQWFSIAVSLVISTCIVLVVSGWVTSLLSPKERGTGQRG